MLRLITKPTAEPVDLEYFISHSKGVAGHDDADVGRKVIAAIRALEQESGRDRLLESTWDLLLSRWPSCGEHIRLLPNASSITSISYTQSDATTGTMPSTDYRLVGEYIPGTAPAWTGGQQVTEAAKVYLKYGKSWPSATLENGDGVIAIRFVAGWKLPEHVPEDLKIAVCLLGGDLLLNREATILASRGMEQRALVRGVEHYVAPYRSHMTPGVHRDIE